MSHELINPPTLSRPSGYSHVVVAGQQVFVAGQAGHRADGTLAGPSMLDQFDQACANVVEALRAAGSRPEEMVSMHIFVTDAQEYRADLTGAGHIYRSHFGRHYPAVSLFEVKGLFDPEAKVELVATAILSDTAPGR